MLNMRHLAPTGFLILVFAASLLLTAGQATASDFMVPVKSIAIINIDEDNKALDYPVEVAYDPVAEETYLVNGGTNKVIVYGPDYFPRVSIGIGRGLITPRGVSVMKNGEIYVCQVKTAKNPRPRITILNGAFFVEREIFLDEIPEAENLRPRTLAVNNNGLIYLAGDRYRGVLVLDNEGNFLRRLQPLDTIIVRGDEEIIGLEIEDKQGEVEELQQGETEDSTPEEELYANIPEEFRPKTEVEKALEYREVTGPVQINFVTIDSTGKLYMISPDSGKIYVYGPDESFLFSFGTKGGSPGQQSNPRSLVIDEQIGVIYVVDYMRHTILAYDMTGRYIFEFGGRGFNPTWFNFPNDLALNNKGQLIVADLFNRRVQVVEVGKEGISYYMDQPAEPGAETGTSEPSAADEPGPELIETVPEPETDSDATLEEFYETIQQEKSSLEQDFIIDEEIIQESPPVQEPPSPFDEPLVAPE